MSTFDEIRKKIADDVKDAKPDGALATNRVGTVVSKPGTEKVTLDASTFQLMECATSAPGFDKTRYCLVEKGGTAQYGNQFITAAGDRAHIITKEAYMLLFSVLRNASKQIQELTNKVTAITEQRDVYKLTIDALRKNGVID